MNVSALSSTRPIVPLGVAPPAPEAAPTEPRDAFAGSVPLAEQVPSGGATTAAPAVQPWQDLKIWLVHGSYTGGHASAARSLEDALSAWPGVRVEVINQADLSSSPLPMSTAAEKALKGGPLANAARRWWFDQNFEGNRVTGWLTDQAMKVEGHFAGELRERIEHEKPDLLVSTMSASTTMLGQWKESGVIHAPVETVVTDFAAHQVWEHDGVDRYYVAHESTRDDLARFGVDLDKVSITGIPIRPTFEGPPRDRAEVKQSLGLDPGKPMVLVMGGSLGYVDFEGTVAALDALPDSFQVAVITGRNLAARKAVAGRSWTHPVRAEEYVNNMPDWIEAADLVVSKPGGLTSSELLARGRAMLIVDPNPGLETRNVDRLTAAGAARTVTGKDGLAAEVGALLRDPAALQAMEGAARLAGHPDSAAVVAGMLVADAVRARAGREADPSS